MPIDVVKQNENYIPRAYYVADASVFLSANEAEIYRDIVHHSCSLTLRHSRRWRGMSKSEYSSL